MVLEGFHKTDRSLTEREIEPEDMGLVADWLQRILENPQKVQDSENIEMYSGSTDISAFTVRKKNETLQVPVWSRSRFEISNRLGTADNTLRIRIHNDIVAKSTFRQNDFRFLDFDNLLVAGKISSFFVDFSISDKGLSLGVYHHDIRQKKLTTIDTTASPLGYEEVVAVLQKDPDDLTKDERMIYEALSEVNYLTSSAFPRPEYN